jgi:hypothetical protein
MGTETSAASTEVLDRKACPVTTPGPAARRRGLLEPTPIVLLDALPDVRADFDDDD